MDGKAKNGKRGGQVMAYFSNGAEGADYEDRYCLNCIHYGKAEGPGCPIWGAHLSYNYDQHREGGEPIKSILGMLIPIRVEDGRAGQCNLFVRK